MKTIGAILGVGLAGVFVGAVIMEVVHRNRPELMKNFGNKTKKTFEKIGEAFKEGYSSNEPARS